MKLTEATKITDLLESNPDLKEKLVSAMPQLKMLTTPVAQTLMKNATIADLAQKAGVSPDDLIGKLEGLLK